MQKTGYFVDQNSKRLMGYSDKKLSCDAKNRHFHLFYVKMDII